MPLQQFLLFLAAIVHKRLLVCVSMDGAAVSIEIQVVPSVMNFAYEPSS